MFHPLSFLSWSVSFTCAPPFLSFQGFALSQLSTAYLLSIPHTDTVPLTALCQQTLSYNTYCLLPFRVHLLPWRRRQQVPLRHWYITTRPHSITSQKTDFFWLTSVSFKAVVINTYIDSIYLFQYKAIRFLYQQLHQWQQRFIIMIINIIILRHYRLSQTEWLSSLSTPQQLNLHTRACK